MEKRETKIIALVALIVGVAALTIGFAAFSRNLTISSSAGYTTTQTEIDVGFSKAETSFTTGSVTAVVTGATATSLTVTADKTSISGISVSFTAESQKAVYDFFIYNNSNYTAYLTGATMAAATGATAASEGIMCSAATNTDGSTTNAELVKQACKAIKYKLEINNPANGSIYTNIFSLNGGFAAAARTFNATSIPAKTGRPVRLTIEYTDTSTAAIPDGNFNVNIGKLTLTFSTQQS